MQQWNIYRANKTHGPFSPGQLKQFADAGKLRPSDVVGLVGSEERFQALKVTGLFASSGMSSPAASQSSEATVEKPLYIRVNGRTLGPFTREHLHKMAASGKLTDSTELSGDGLSWATAGHFGISSGSHTSLPPSQHNLHASVPSQVGLATRDRTGPTGTELAPKIWHVHISGHNHGPMSQQELIRLRNEGRISDDILVWRDGFENWIPLKNVIETKDEGPKKSTDQQWYISKGGISTGPFGEQTVRDRITAGQLSPVDMVCPLGETTWKAASKAFSFNAPEGLDLVALGQQQSRNANSQSPKVPKEPIYTSHRDFFRGLGKKQFQPYYLLIPSLVAIGVVVTVVAFATINNRRAVIADLALEAGDENESIPDPNTPAEPAAKEIINSIGMKLNLIPAGTFMMGSPPSEADRADGETQHRVTLTQDFYLGTTEVTQGQWEAVMGTTPWRGRGYVQEGGNNAAIYISWDDAAGFCRKLSASEGRIYRLPTEAEWEYACRAGTTTAYSFGDDAAQLSEYGWWGGFYDGNSKTQQYAHAVGLKRANAFGLHDMHGNVWEWCSDWFGDYPDGSVTDPVGPGAGSARVYRGGSWGFGASLCRSASRDWDLPLLRFNHGFRVALSSVKPLDASTRPPEGSQASASETLPPVSNSKAGERTSPQRPQVPIAPFSENEAKTHQAAWSVYLDHPVELTNSIGMKLKLIPPGTFMMGSPESEVERSEDETQHRVTLTQDFYLGTTEVTQGQWESVMGTAPWKEDTFVQEGSSIAATYVSWYDAMAFCRKLSAKEGRAYRLPTEAEWEYACRAGTTTAYSFGDDDSLLSEYGWWGGFFGDDSSQTAKHVHAVGLKRANRFGLYDLHGNVWEWCSDWYGAYPTGNVTNPQGATNGVDRVVRGGSWSFDAAACRAANRSPGPPSSRIAASGFRVALSSVKTPVASIRPPESSHASPSITLPPVSNREASERTSLQRPRFPIAPFSENEAKTHQAAWSAYLDQPVELTNSIGMKLRLIPPGAFMMGSPKSEASRLYDESQHPATMTRHFYLGTTEVTQSQWLSVMGTTPWEGDKYVQEGGSNAATNVSWYDAVEFCRKLGDREGRSYSLPTEAEWEYACRAGTTTAYSFGNDAVDLTDYGWWGEVKGRGNLRPEPYAHAVGLKLANAFGLYDMHGNVYEWCSDWYDAYYTGAKAMALHSAAGGSKRVLRGGSWPDLARDCRSARRDKGVPDARSNRLGFRVTLGL